MSITVYGSYDQLRPFQKRLKEETERGSFNNSMGRVEFVSVNHDLIAFIEAKGLGSRAERLGADGREDEMRRLLSDAFRDLITSRIEAPGTLGLVVADLEMLYAYDLGNNALPFLRQVAIKGFRRGAGQASLPATLEALERAVAEAELRSFECFRRPGPGVRYTACRGGHAEPIAGRLARAGNPPRDRHIRRCAARWPA